MAREVSTYRIAVRGDLLPQGDIVKVRHTIIWGGLCIAPSDTCYSLAGDPVFKGVIDDIDNILDKNGSSFSLTFGSQVMAERFVEFSVRHYRILENLSPSDPVTLVAPIKRDIDPMVRSQYPRALRTNNEIGVRLPHSWVERQISTELDKPITTTAIRYPDGEGVKNFDDALSIVVQRMEQLDIDRPLCAIQHPTIKRGALSTVLGVGSPDQYQNGIFVIREGAVEISKVQKVVGRMTFSEYEDWT